MGFFQNTRITLVNPNIEQLYSGMVPGLISKKYNFDESSIDLIKLTLSANCRFFKDTLVAIEPDKKIILCKERGRIEFDILSISTGSDTKKIPGLKNSNFLNLKPFHSFFSDFEVWIASLNCNNQHIRIGVIGGGIAALETILAVKKRLESHLKDMAHNTKLDIFFLTKEKSLFQSVDTTLRKQCLRVVKENKITVIPSFLASKIVGNHVFTPEGNTFQLDLGILATGPSPQPWTKMSGLPLCGNGFIRVNKDLTCEHFDNIFVTGDAASLTKYPELPKSGLIAVRQGQTLVKNIQKKIDKKRLVPFKPQVLKLSLIGTATGDAIASYNQLTLRGAIFWHLKNFIDLRFINKFKSFTKMKKNDLPLNELQIERCGGCGSKVGSNILRGVLEEFKKDQSFYNIDNMDEDAGFSISYSDKLNLHTIDGFRQLIDEPYDMGVITAHHSVSDITAMGGTPKTALALVGVPLNDEKLMKNDLRLALRGLLDGLKTYSVTVIGGHTNEAESISLGLAINGVVDKDQVVKKTNIQLGERIILTQAIGAGVIFAGLMAGHTKGKWLNQIVNEIKQRNDDITDFIGKFASSCTDVTGFGLVGHLVEMTKNNPYGITINLEKIPFFEGARELSLKKVRSSLFPQNINVPYEVDCQIKDDPRFDLCFDPQTAGGFLLSVDADKASHCVDMLLELGYSRCCEIGTVVDSQSGVKICW